MKRKSLPELKAERDRLNAALDTWGDGMAFAFLDVVERVEKLDRAIARRENPIPPAAERAFNNRHED